MNMNSKRKAIFNSTHVNIFIFMKSPGCHGIVPGPKRNRTFCIPPFAFPPQSALIILPFRVRGTPTTFDVVCFDAVFDCLPAPPCSSAQASSSRAVAVLENPHWYRRNRPVEMCSDVWRLCCCKRRPALVLI